MVEALRSEEERDPPEKKSGPECSSVRPEEWRSEEEPDPPGKKSGSE